MRSFFCCLAAALTVSAASAAERRGLNIYFIDTEGGAATLIVTPAGESVLIDTGNPGQRDPGRIHRVATEVAGLKAIDHVIVTHWHADHYGGVPRVAELMPVHHFYDRGQPQAGVPETEDPSYRILMGAYQAATKGKAKALRPGDTIPLKQVEGAPAVKLLCLCSTSKFLPERPGAPANPAAKDHKPQAPDPSDNARSLGFRLSYGGWRFLDLGDLTWNMEYKLVAPTDKIGPIDVYQVTHHGLEISNNPVLINTVRPRVAICNNGPRKGGHPSVIANLRRSPEIQAIYQLHRNMLSAAQDNTDPEYIANNEETDACHGEFIHLAVAPDAKSYTVAIGEKGKPRRFETRRTEH